MACFFLVLALTSAFWGIMVCFFADDNALYETDYYFLFVQLPFDF